MWSKIKKWVIIIGISISILTIILGIIIHNIKLNRLKSIIDQNDDRLQGVISELEVAEQDHKQYVDQLERMKQLRDQYRSKK